MDKLKVLELINKLSVLSNDPGAFEGEIANSSMKIKQLMDKYSISQMDVDEFLHKEHEQEMKDLFTSESCGKRHKTVKKWHWELARIIGRITNTKHYISRGIGSSSMTFFGNKDNAKIATELYALWFENIERVAELATKEHRREILRKYGDRKNFFSWVSNNHPEDDPKYFRTSWITGCIHGMYEKVKEEEQSVASENTSLVLYKEKVEIAYREFSSGFQKISTGSSKGFSPSGYSKGHKFGSSVNIGSKELKG